MGITVIATQTPRAKRSLRSVAQNFTGAQAPLLLSIALLCVAIRMFTAPNLQSHLRSTSTDFIRESSRKTPLPQCPSSFYPDSNSTEPPPLWPCVVRAPLTYTTPREGADALWKVPRSALARINESEFPFKLYFAQQKWAVVSADNASINFPKGGGTVGYKFPSNFAYARLLVNISRPPNCSEGRPPLLVDMGGGIGSVAAALKDKRGGGGKLASLTYTLTEGELYMQSLVAARRLPAFAGSFDGLARFPPNSIHVAHCKYCWHHTHGLRKWLLETDRIMRPGGVFVFVFTERLEKKGVNSTEYEEIIKELGWSCERRLKIMRICRKAGAPACPYSRPRVLTERTAATKRLMQGAITYAGRTMRLATFGAPSADDAAALQDGAGEAASFALHVVSRSREADAAELLATGRLAILHGGEGDQKYSPFYPRSFDAVALGCGDGMPTDTTWADVHRLVRPGGVLLMPGHWCSAAATILEKGTEKLFNIVSRTEDGVVATRIQA